MPTVLIQITKTVVVAAILAAAGAAAEALKNND